MTDPLEIHDPSRSEFQTSKAITITLIISCAVIVLACIAALSIVLTAFFLNAPW